MGRIMTDLDDDREFFEQGDADAGSLTWPKAPSETALKWPLVLIFCPKGHELGTVNLSFESGVWTLHSTSDVQATPDRHHRSYVSIERTVFRCAECQRRRPEKQQALPVRGPVLVEMYRDAVKEKKDSIRLP